MTSVFYGVRSSKTQRACGLAAVLVASLLTKSVNAGDWPAWRGPNHDGVSLETGLPDSTQQVLWRTAYGGRSTPVVHDGQVYVINLAGQGVTEQERVMAISLETGTHDLGTSLQCFPYRHSQLSRGMDQPGCGC
jgi:hypothetical protein